jgi:hypothetical protein
MRHSKFCSFLRAFFPKSFPLNRYALFIDKLLTGSYFLFCIASLKGRETVDEAQGDRNKMRQKKWTPQNMVADKTPYTR